MGGWRERGLGGISYVQDEMRDRAVPGQEGFPRSAKHGDGERRSQSQKDLDASRKASKASGREGAAAELWSAAGGGHCPSSSLRSAPLFASTKRLLLLLERLRYLLSSAPSSASAPCEQKWPLAPSCAPTAQPQSFPTLAKEREKRPCQRPVWTLSLQRRGRTRDRALQGKGKCWNSSGASSAESLPREGGRRWGRCSGCVSPRSQRAQAGTVPPEDIQETGGRSDWDAGKRGKEH